MHQTLQTMDFNHLTARDEFTKFVRATQIAESYYRITLDGQASPTPRDSLEERLIGDYKDQWQKLLRSLDTQDYCLSFFSRYCGGLTNMS